MVARTLFFDIAEPEVSELARDVGDPHLVGDDVLEDDRVMRGEVALRERVIDDEGSVDRDTGALSRSVRSAARLAVPGDFLSGGIEEPGVEARHQVPGDLDLCPYLEPRVRYNSPGCKISSCIGSVW